MRNWFCLCFQNSSAKTILVKIWDDDCEAQLIGKEADEWFSKKLNTRCRLVYMPQSTERKVDARICIE